MTITKGHYIIMGKYIIKKYTERTAIEQKYVKYNTILFDVLTINDKTCFYVKDAFGLLDREQYLSGNYSRIEDFNGELSIVHGLPCIGFMSELFDYEEIPNNNLTKSEWREAIKAIQILYSENYVFCDDGEYFLTKYGFIHISINRELKLTVINPYYDKGALADLHEYLSVVKSAPAPSLKHKNNSTNLTSNLDDIDEPFN
jgi:hypothetical protein